MHDQLIPILNYKKLEVNALQEIIRNYPTGELAQLVNAETVRLTNGKSFANAVAYGEFIKVIAEIKRRSPSKGLLNTILNPVALAAQYVQGGAVAISVLTDACGFGGSVDDLRAVSAGTAHTLTPILRKDFLIDPIQIAQAVLYGADAVLLIAGILGAQLPQMLATARQLNIDALVEVHTPDEAEHAVAAGAQLIGVNNRDLHTFRVDTQRAFQLLDYLPATVTKIAESGIEDPSLAKDYHAAGYATVLVGETLVKSADPALWISRCRHD